MKKTKRPAHSQVEGIRAEVRAYLLANRRFLKVSPEEHRHTRQGEWFERSKRLEDFTDANGDRIFYSAFDPVKGVAAVTAARDGDGDALRALLDLANTALVLDRPLPYQLKMLVADYIKERLGSLIPGERGEEFRDRVIVDAVKIAERAGLYATRNDSLMGKAGHACGCSLVAEELALFDVHITEEGVKKVWKKRGPN
jgi:hypothetical protein